LSTDFFFFFFFFVPFHILLVLDRLEENKASFSFDTPFTDNGARASDNLDGLTVLVVLAKANHLSEVLVAIDLYDWDRVLVAKSGHELGVSWLITAAAQHTDVSGAAIESLDSLAETTCKTIMHQRGLEGLLQSFLSSKWTSDFLDLGVDNLLGWGSGNWGIFGRHDWNVRVESVEKEKREEKKTWKMKEEEKSCFHHQPVWREEEEKETYKRKKNTGEIG
jgi:hypothetical protein